jgi:hypothetical protein
MTKLSLIVSALILLLGTPMLAAKDISALPGSISGTWDLSVTFGERSTQPVAHIKQDGTKLSGTYTGLMGTVPIQGTVNGTDIIFKVAIKSGKETVTLTYNGTIVDKASMNGTLTFGQLGEGTWTAKKRP